ncbi:MAG: flagellar filament capping protein FliD [Magnetococcales bacterium]|nr:flagellar filament capping protein FliD [Magnetococcales bacterium]
MASSFAVGGLASGLPSDMVDQLMATKQQRLKAYENDKSFFTGQKSAFGELKTKLLNLSSVSETLQETSAWSPHTSSSSDEDKVAVSASSSAVSGTHQIGVSRLASSSTLMTSGGVTNSTDKVKTINSFSFTYNDRDYSVVAGNANPFGIIAGDTLADIASKITTYDFEDASGTDEAGISASVLNDGTNYRLVLTPKDQGAYERNNDGTTKTSRITGLTMDMVFENSDGTSTTATWNTGGDSSGFSTGAGLTDATATIDSIAAANFSFTYGTNTWALDASTGNQLKKDGVALVAGAATLDNVATAINQSVDGVSASVVNDGTNNYLVIDGSTASQVISGVTVNLGFTQGTSTYTVNSTSTGFFQSSEGQDAKITVDGLSNIYSSSNVVDEVLPGVAMTIKGITTSSVSVTVSDDTAALKETLNSFTTAYNDVIDYIGKNKETVFSGATLTRSIISQMRSVLNTSTHKGDKSGDVLSPFSILAEMGLRTDQKTGKISFNDSTLDEAIATNFTALTNLFTNTQTAVDTGNNAGVAHRFESLIDDITNSSSGSLTGRSDGLQARIDGLEDSIERENYRLEKVRERLTLKFANLEQLVNSLNASGNALTSALGGLSK